MANGRAWKILNELTMAAYVMGYRKGVVLAGSQLNNGDIAERLDRFFDDPRNLPLRVGEAIGRVIHPIED